ncbi:MULTISPECIES: SMI1/KNR4 family protein [unclassified Anabaena]|uniref:SMI1/KNR4 family protein n=1 Tax=unclassified Anabaena TaxID=2619674 RepID=UPI001447CCB7|nr:MULTISPECIES: SMI1/KNR4 family protein [unclassified Anabaena]MTJ10907.1 SMI1/KNR4 family protein [Anabaena sp. UHCC 0204]MTJ51862.1 SMI1/KNR4 family protein [Anabaena sp. UHCC 0253]
MSQITKSNILNYLENYCYNPQLITDIQDIPQDVLSKISQSWLGLLSLEEVDFTKLRELWQPILHRVEVIIEDLESRLQGLAILIEDNKPPSLLYVFLNDEELYYHRGFPPLQEQEIMEGIKPFWSKLPEDLKKLYTINNGWLSLFDLSMGHKPVDKISVLSSTEWNLEPEVIRNLPLNYTKTIILFANGGSGYIGFELSEDNEMKKPRPLIFWSNKPTEPDLDIKFWTIFNTWISIDLQSKDYNQTWLEE